MSPTIVAARMLGQIVMWIGGWYRIMGLIIIGFMIINPGAADYFSVSGLEGANPVQTKLSRASATF